MRAVLFLLASVWLTISVRPAVAQETLVFREPEPGPLVNFITQVLEEAYADLGVQLEYRPLPRLRGEQLAADGEIAGELGRLGDLDDRFKGLNQVPFKLFEFDVLLVANRNQCGLCTIDHVDSLAYVSGMHSVEKVLNAQNFDRPLFQQTELQQVAKLLSAGRIEAALLTDFQLRSIEIGNPDDYVVYKMGQETGFHYLHDNYARYVEPLHQKLLEMQISGRIAQLREQHNLALPKSLTPIVLPERLVAASAIHTGLTNPDGSGKLWSLVRQTYADVTEDIRTSASNWPRAYKMLREQRADIMVGVREEQFTEGFVYSKTPVGMDDALYLFTADGQTEQSILDGEAPKTLCFSGGDYQQNLLPGEFSYYRANAPLDCFAMLDLGRVDGVIDYKDNLPDWTEKPYQRHRLTTPVPLYLGFNDSPLGRLLKGHFERQQNAARPRRKSPTGATLRTQK